MKKQITDFEQVIDHAVADARRLRVVDGHHAAMRRRLATGHRLWCATVMLSLMTATSLVTVSCTTVPDGRAMRSSASHAEVLALSNQLIEVLL